MDSLGAAMGLPAGVLGAVLGFVILFCVLLVLSWNDVPTGAYALVGLGIVAVNYALGFWPLWAVIIVALVAALMAWRAVASGGEK